jgi:predicted transcriptional regulator
VHHFSPAVSRDAYASGQLESLTAKLTGGSIAPLITHLIEHEKITPEEIQRLRRILRERKTSGEDR